MTMSTQNRIRNSRRNGAVLIYCTVIMTVLLGSATLAVDWGRIQLAKTQLIAATDAAARAGAGSLPQSPAAAVAAAQWAASQNPVDGTGLSLQVADIQIGTWTESTKTFTALYGTDQYNGNAVRVLGKRNAARSSAVPISIGRVFGIQSTDIQAECVAELIGLVNVNQQVAATANPFLAGMPAGSVASTNNPHHNPDYAGTTSNPKQSPLTVNLPLTAGASLTFDSIAGTAQHDPNLSSYQPDGDLSDIGHNNTTPSDSASQGSVYYNENGIADVRAPINALVGVFLDDSNPSTTAAPANLDFSSDASRDFQSLKPQLKQIFFIGDGLDSHGAAQQFVVPQGATHLYLATWDYYEWNNNSGTRTVKVNRPAQIVTVK